MVELPLVFGGLACFGNRYLVVGGDQRTGRGGHLRGASTGDRGRRLPSVRFGCIAGVTSRSEPCGPRRPLRACLVVLHRVRKLVRDGRYASRRLGRVLAPVEDDVVADREGSRVHRLRGVRGVVAGVYSDSVEAVTESGLDGAAHGRIERLPFVASHEVERG